MTRLLILEWKNDDVSFYWREYAPLIATCAPQFRSKRSVAGCGSERCPCLQRENADAPMHRRCDRESCSVDPPSSFYVMTRARHVLVLCAWFFSCTFLRLTYRYETIETRRFPLERDNYFDFAFQCREIERKQERARQNNKCGQKKRETRRSLWEANNRLLRWLGEEPV